MSIENFFDDSFTKVEDLKPRAREIKTIVKIVSKTPVREVTSRRDYSTHRVSQALVGDETASISLTLWDDDIDKIHEEDTIQITNGYVNLFRGNMRLNIGRYGRFEHLEESPITEINTENNLSEKLYEQERRYRPYRPTYGGRRSYQRRRY